MKQRGDNLKKKKSVSIANVYEKHFPFPQWIWKWDILALCVLSCEDIINLSEIRAVDPWLICYFEQKVFIAYIKGS